MLWLCGNFFFIFPMENLDICPLRCDNNEVKKISLWACSAVGSAPHSHCGGRRFESDQVHWKNTISIERWCFLYGKSPPPAVFNILAFTCVNLHLRANAHLRHVIFLITRKFRYNLPLIPKTAARYFPQQRHSIHSVLNLRARITVQNNCSHQQQVHPPVSLTSHHHEQISHPPVRYQCSES